MSGSNTFDKIDARREFYRRRLKQRQATSRSKLRRNFLLVFSLTIFVLFILGRRGGDNLSNYSANDVGSTSVVKDKIKKSHSNYTAELQSSSTHTNTTQTINETTKFTNDTRGGNNLSKYSNVGSSNVVKDKTMKESQSMNYTAVLQSSSHTKTTQTTDTHTQANDTTQEGRVKFIPYPHKTLGSGDAMKCNWTTIPLNETNNTYDYTQQKAFSEGVCIPQNISIHIFSSNEAKECLSSKRVIISGDSYNKQLFVGLADILLSKHIQNGKEILDSTYRNTVTAITNSVLAKRYKNDPNFPNVQYKCERQCYGNYATRPFNEVCAECINSYTEDDNTIAVVGAGIHLTGNKLREGRSTVEEMNKFLDQAKKVIWVSMPSYQTEKVPDKFRDSHAGHGHIYDEMLPSLAPVNPKQPFLDVFQLTDSCNAENCSNDGGHRSRFVNRFKAQLLLNTLCEYSIR